MIETPQQFGVQSHLVGVLTQPRASDGGTAPPPVAFLLFNAGAIPRLGPHRLNVKLARALAAQGHPSLRFDLAGQGDSRRLSGDDGDHDDGTNPAVRDLQAAMDHLQSTLGITRFAIVGICSGAVDAYWLGLADTRVAALMLFDGFWYRTRWSRPMRHWRRLREKSALDALRATRVKLARLLGMRPWADSAAANLFSASNCPSRSEFGAAMQGLVDRQAAVLLVYSGSILDYYSYSAQFRHAFDGAPWLDRVRCEYRPDIDHSFVSLQAQQRVTALLLGWLPDVQRACG